MHLICRFWCACIALAIALLSPAFSGVILAANEPRKEQGQDKAQAEHVDSSLSAWTPVILQMFFNKPQAQDAGATTGGLIAFKLVQIFVGADATVMYAFPPLAGADKQVLEGQPTSPEGLKECKATLEAARKTPPATAYESARCAAAAAILVANNQEVPDYDKWVNANVTNALSHDMGTHLAKAREEIKIADIQVCALLIIADVAMKSKDFDSAVTIYRDLRNALAHQNELRLKEMYMLASKQLFNCLLLRADALEATRDKSKGKKAGADREEAVDVAKDILIALGEKEPCLSIPDAKSEFLSEWILKHNKGVIDFSILTKIQANDRVFNAVSLKNKRASYSFIEIGTFDTTEKLLAWQWQLEKAPPGATNQSGKSANHPLNVIVVLYTDHPVLLHYVWDTTPDVDLKWNEELLSLEGGLTSLFGKLFGKEIDIPHIVVRTSEDKLGQWYLEVRDIEKDFKSFYPNIEEVPPVVAVAIQTHMQDNKSESQGAIGDLRLVPKNK